MEYLAFWVFILVMELLIPACMLCFGWLFIKKPPKNINSVYGYRTPRSMRNQQTWDFAHAYSGRFWFRAGEYTLAFSLVWMVFLLGKTVSTVGYFGLILMAIQLVPLLAVIFATERALKREFDDRKR